MGKTIESFPWVRDLVEEAPVIAPSLLAADFADLRRELARIKESGVKVLHIDVMDGHFVPNISIGVPIVESLRKATDMKLDVHLMISNPEKYVEAFRKAGADSLLIHIEAVPNPVELLRKIRDLGAAPGLVINPGTPAEAVFPYIEEADLFLTMSVQPGFGGQAFRPEVLEKVRQLKKRARPDTIFSIDGGIHPSTIAPCAEAGVQMFIAGTAIFGTENYKKQVELLKDLAQNRESAPSVACLP